MDAPTSADRRRAAIAAPAYVLDQTWNARAWNVQAARLFVGWLDGHNDRNLLRYVFLSPLARHVLPDWEKRARRVLAEFRADSGRYLDDPQLKTLVDGLSQQSPILRALLAGARGRGARRRRAQFRPPAQGPTALRAGRLHPGEPRSDLKLVVLTSRSAHRRSRRAE